MRELQLSLLLQTSEALLLNFGRSQYFRKGESVALCHPLSELMNNEVASMMNNYDIMLSNIFYQEAKFMAWYDEAIFYHIYPLGMTGAPKENDYSEPVSRLNTLLPWINHIKEIGEGIK